MMRNKTASSMQKTYDECYLICSTAVYFESQGNEEEALRSWRSALDQIYYHNAYRVPATYRPKTETEKALQDSLRDMELQCKERVELLEALRRSRIESNGGTENATNGVSPASRPPVISTPRQSLDKESPGWIGGGTIRAVDYTDIAGSGPSLPERLQRPAVLTKRSSDGARANSLPSASADTAMRMSMSPPTLPVPSKKPSRSPSPEKKTTMRTTLRSGKRSGKSPLSARMNAGPPPASKAATLAWGSVPSRPSVERLGQSIGGSASSSTLTVNSMQRDVFGPRSAPGAASSPLERADIGSRSNSFLKPEAPADALPSPDIGRDARLGHITPPPSARPQSANDEEPPRARSTEDLISFDPISYSQQEPLAGPLDLTNKPKLSPLPATKPPISYPSYMNEYPVTSATKESPPVPPKSSRLTGSSNKSSLPTRQRSPQRRERPSDRSNAFGPRIGDSPKSTANISSPRAIRMKGDLNRDFVSSESEDERRRRARPQRAGKRPEKQKEEPILAENHRTPSNSSTESFADDVSPAEKEWNERVSRLLKNLPRGVDEAAAKQILNEIVIKGDEVHWDDVAGLDIAKNALKEAVVYPFLRPDLFMGLREPARGMLLFGPPGTGKTMLARAVATESKSTFFSISASSLTSKYLGESEKLVRALFVLAKALAPSIIFVDEIDSLLSSRSGSGEHEATRRIKTEFLIQWSDLARAAAGREQTDKDKGDASRVLVLAATNLPWAIDEAARRRFVRRQYIPLPEPHVRAMQLRTLMSHQKHSMADKDLDKLVELTEGFSGSDITALAKDAAMGPLRSLGEALLHMSPDEIRPIQLEDFEASLKNIRPSVSKEGLKEFEDWAREFGERGG